MNFRRITKNSLYNRKAIFKSKICYCYYCLGSFLPSDIVLWCDDEQTALCPICRIDAVLVPNPYFTISKRLLKRLRLRAFGYPPNFRREEHVIQLIIFDDSKD